MRKVASVSGLVRFVLECLDFAANSPTRYADTRRLVRSLTGVSDEAYRYNLTNQLLALAAVRHLHSMIGQAARNVGMTDLKPRFDVNYMDGEFGK